MESSGRWLILFLGLRLAKHLAERGLSWLNRRSYLDPRRQAEAQALLHIGPGDFAKTLAYAEDRHRFAAWSTWIELALGLAFLASGGLGWAERLATGLLPSGSGEVAIGLVFFALLGLLSLLAGLPLAWYRTFVIEAKHGFNRQTPKSFVIDRLKGLMLGALFGAPILGLLIWIMGTLGDWWWVYAWGALSAFSLVTAWLFPTILAPLFNKFTPLTSGTLKAQVDDLAERVGFHSSGLFVMDASKRSSHGNAYFTGVFGKKRIVLFDTLLKDLKESEVVAVLAHELGHFKLHHVRWGVLRGVLQTGATFYLLSLCLGLEPVYRSFGLGGISAYGALAVFGLWLGVLDFLLAPLEAYLSRRHEFAADRFASQHLGGSSLLEAALLKLREQNHAMPISHPWFSAVYHSHPPLEERLRAMRQAATT